MALRRIQYVGNGQNILHNGAMQVAQRGTSAAGKTVSAYYTADRWNASINALGTWTQSVEADGPTGSGFTKSLKMLCTTASASPAAGAFAGISQVVEGQNIQALAKGTASAQPMTLSFWVKSNATGTYVAEPYDLVNARHCSLQYTINASGTWEKKTLVIPPDTTGTLTNNNSGVFQVQFWLGTGTTYSSGSIQPAWVAATSANRAVGQTNVAGTLNNYWQVTGVQLEIGTTASSFNFKPYDQELQECQRYYYLHASGTTKTIGLGSYWSAAIISTVVQFPVTMRDTPVADFTSGTNYYGFARNGGYDTVNAFTLNVGSTTAAELVNNDATASGTVGQAGHVYTNHASAYIGFKADF